MKKIALVTDGWKRLITYAWLEGILEKSRELGLDICVHHFNTNGNWSHDKKHNQGEYTLYTLPDFSEYDGIVFDCSNMTDSEQIDRTVKLLKKTNIPVVSLGYAVDGFYYVGNDNKRLFRNIMDHLHDVHHFTDYVFAGGPDYNYENRMRFEAFKEALNDYGIPLTDEMYMFGDFDFGTGERYMEEWIAAGKNFPECFVCANDNIAAGMCSAAARHELKVPGDFCVTGFDNLDKAAYFNPQITTVEHNRGSVAQNALNVLNRIWEGKEVETFTYLFSECVPSESCGCPNNGRVDYRNYIKWQIEYQVKKDRDDEDIMVLEKQITDCENFDDMFEHFADYVENQGCEGVYIVVDKTLLSASLDESFSRDGYNMEKMVVGYASESHHRITELNTYDDLKRHMDLTGSGQSYVYSAIHFRNQMVGFIVMKNPEFLYDKSNLYDMNSVFVVTLEGLYKQMKLENANAKMKELYNRDTLTGLYNRVAYGELVLPEFKKYSEQGIVCAMIFFDVDHFKELNDTYGHKFGDSVLIKTADILKQDKPEYGHAFRFGGDEFVVFFPYATEDKVDDFVNKVMEHMDRVQIQMSHGVILTDPESEKTLDEYLVMADQKMYETKRRRHEKQRLESDKRVFLKGVDISSLPEHLDGGEKYYTVDGRNVTPFELLKEYKINSVRLRIWNEPGLVPESKGYCDLAHTIDMAKKIKQYGMHFFLDFHYSDFWADPGQQRKPHAWEKLSFGELIKAVHEYTWQVLDELRKNDCLPDMVQVGNEIRSGMLFPDGEAPNYANLAKLVNAGISAVREISEDITVMIHLDQGGRYYYLKEWFDAMFEAGMKPIDAIGISFYSFWHGTFMDLRDTMSELIERYDLPVYVVETAHPWRQCEGEHISEDQMKTAGFPAGEENQKKSLELIMNIATQVSDNRPTGVYYWEPLCAPSKGYGSWDENMGMLDENGKALVSFEGYRDFEPAAPKTGDLDSYMTALYTKSENDRPYDGANLIPNGDFTNGSRGWWITTRPDAVEVEDRDGEIYFASKGNFSFQICRDVMIEQAGCYELLVDYRGTNTTGVKVKLYLKVIRYDGEDVHSREIFPSDVDFVTHSLGQLELTVGQVQVGIVVDAPPIFGRIKNIRLVRTNNNL